MKAPLFLALIIIIFTSPFSHADTNKSSPKVRYFTKIVGIISPFIDYKLTGEIEEERTATLNHYKVNYDQSGRINTISYYHGIYPSEDSYFYTHTVRFQYSDRSVTRRYYDMSGKPASMWRHYYLGGAIHSEQFDKFENHTELKLFSATGEQVTTGLNAVRFVMKPIEDGKFIQTQYDADNNPVVLTNYFPFETSLITTDLNGHLKDIINLNPETRQVENHSVAKFSQVIFDFDAYGNEMGWKFVDTHGELVNRPNDIESPGYASWTYTFDWRDREINAHYSFEMNYFDKDGTKYCDSNRICSTRFEKDSFGELTAQSFHDKKGALIFNSDVGFAKLTIVRDSKGRRSESRYYESDGKLLTKGVAVQKYFYSNDGTVSVNEYDAKMLPVKTLSPDN